MMAEQTRRNLGLGMLLIIFAGSTVFCQPKLVVNTPSSYQPGDRVDPDTLLLDRLGQAHSLKEIIRPDAKVLVMIIFGGAFKTPPDAEQFRGPLWCRDSFDDLAVQRALVRRFEGEPVQFIPVAVPPVYKPETYGWEGDPFLGKPDDSEEYQQAVHEFIEATEREKNAGLLPFEDIYYDPKFRLAQNRKERELGPEFGEVYPWQGKLKWANDPRRYGTPTIWIIGADGTVMAEPLFGNDYDSSPPEISYGYLEASQAIEEALSHTRSAP